MSGWGIEALHSWDGGSVILGDLSGWPRYRIEQIQGLRSLGDLDAAASEPPGLRGEIPLDRQRRGKTVTYQGTIEARSLADLRDAEERLLAAFDPSYEREMTITPHASYDTPATRTAAVADRDDLTLLHHFTRPAGGFTDGTGNSTPAENNVTAGEPVRDVPTGAINGGSVQASAGPLGSGQATSVITLVRRSDGTTDDELIGGY